VYASFEGMCGSFGSICGCLSVLEALLGARKEEEGEKSGNEGCV